MTPINNEALDNARRLIRRDFGDLADLPEELRNTLVNVYYEYAFLGLETKGEFAYPSGVALEGNLMDGLTKFFGDAAHLQAAVECLPQIVRGIREARNAGKDCKVTISLTLDVFKYKIPNADKKSGIRLAMERPFYAAKVREIPNLSRLL